MRHEVHELLTLGEQADQGEAVLPGGWVVDDEIAIRQKRLENLSKAKAVLDARAQERTGYFDYEILEHFPHFLASGIDKYWAELQISEDSCNKLAKAKIIALRKWPVFLSWSLFGADDTGAYHSIGEIFGRFDWKV